MSQTQQRFVFSFLFALLLLYAWSPAHYPEVWGDERPPAPQAKAPTDLQGDPLPPQAITRLGTTRLRHHDGFVAATFSADGRFVTLVDSQRAIRRWDSATGKFHEALFDEGVPCEAAFSARGKYVALVSTVRLRVFETNTGSEIFNTDQVGRALAFSPDQAMLASANAKGILRFWDLDKGKLAWQWDGSGLGGPKSLSFSPDGTVLALADYTLPRGPKNAAAPAKEQAIVLLDVNAGKVLGKLEGHRDYISGLAFSRDGKSLLSTSADKTLRFWDVAQRKELRQVVHNGGILVPSPDGSVIASAPWGADVVRLWDPGTGNEVRVIEECGSRSTCLAFSPDGSRLVTAGLSHTVHLWDVNTGKELLPFPGHQAAVVSVAFAPDGKTLASRSKDQTVRVWDLAGSKEVHRLRIGDALGIWPVDPSTREAGTLAYSPSGKTLAAVGGIVGANNNYTKKIHLWDVATGQSQLELTHRGEVYRNAGSVGFSPDGELLVAAVSDRTRVWSVASGEEQTALNRQTTPGGVPAHTDYVAAFSPDGHHVAVGGYFLLLWDWPPGATQRRIQAQGAYCLSFSANGQLLASCIMAPNPTVAISEVVTGDLVCSIDAHKDGTNCVAFSPDGRLLATAGEKDKAVRVWDMLTGNELAKFEGHTGAVYAVAFSPDGRLVASGSADTTILVWDVSGVRSRLPATQPDTKQLDQLWAELGAADASPAYRAILTLAGAGEQATAYLRERLKPMVKTDAQRVTKLLADLEADDFTVRQAAAAELKRLGRAVEPELRRRLLDKPPLDLRKHLEALLAEAPTSPFDHEQVRAHRSLQVLERIGSPAARAILKELADGSDLTRAARGALERLDRFPVAH